MKPLGLRRRIRSFAAKPSITTRFEKELTARGIKQPKVWYSSQKEHWLGWLEDYNGPGYYGRKNSSRTAEFCYNHINCSPMVLWLGEASGVDKKTVKKAKRSALRTKGNMGPQCKAIRQVIPWAVIESCLK